jgi:hypothetical protein
MFYILTVPGEEPVYPYTLTDLMRANPGTSFPRDMTNFDASDWHCYPVQDTTPPTGNGKPTREQPEYIAGVWYERWSLAPYTQQDIDQQWDAVRSDRNARLSSCDWTQVADAPVDREVWAIYRQELRDVPAQPDPFNITWPEAPE